MMPGCFTALCWLSLPLAAGAAEDVEARLEAMQARMDRLEDRLEATTEQLAEAEQRLGEQRSMLEQAAKANPSSGAAAFLDSLEFGGWMSASYWYNFNHAANERLVDANVGSVGQSHPFHPTQSILLRSALVRWATRRPESRRLRGRDRLRQTAGCSRTATPRQAGQGQQPLRRIATRYHRLGHQADGKFAA
jgi:hypothetical protein